MLTSLPSGQLDAPNMIRIQGQPHKQHLRKNLGTTKRALFEIRSLGSVELGFVSQEELEEGEE